MPPKFVNPYKVFLGQLYANVPRGELERVMKQHGVPLPDAGLYMVLRSLAGYLVNLKITNCLEACLTNYFEEIIGEACLEACLEDCLRHAHRLEDHHRGKLAVPSHFAF